MATKTLKSGTIISKWCLAAAVRVFMAKLVETSAGTWACSECGEVIPIPSIGTTTEKEGTCLSRHSTATLLHEVFPDCVPMQDGEKDGGGRIGHTCQDDPGPAPFFFR